MIELIVLGGLVICAGVGYMVGYIHRGKRLLDYYNEGYTDGYALGQQDMYDLERGKPLAPTIDMKA